MDDWSLMQILDFLDFGDLANIASLDPRFHQLILDHYVLTKFDLKGAEAVISISDLFTYQARYKFYSSDGKLTQDFQTSSGNNGMLAAVTFCSIFAKITVKNTRRVDAQHMHQLADDLNKYCSTTSQTVHLSFDWSNSTATFEYATNIELNWEAFKTLTSAITEDFWQRIYNSQR